MIKVVFLFKNFKQTEIPPSGEHREMGLGADYTQHCEECSDGSCSLVWQPSNPEQFHIFCLNVQLSTL